MDREKKLIKEIVPIIKTANLMAQVQLVKEKNDLSSFLEDDTKKIMIVKEDNYRKLEIQINKSVSAFVRG